MCIFAPYRNSFLAGDVETWGDTVDLIISVFFLFDMLISFNTAYYDSYFILVHERKRIAMYYAKTWLLVDLITIVPFELFFRDSRMSSIPQVLRFLIRLAKMLRVLRIFKASKHYVKSISSYFHLKPSRERIWTTFIISIVIFHIVACIWFSLTIFESDNTQNWKQRMGYMDKSTGELYLISLYWTVQTVITVGYGDEPAVTAGEKTVAILWMFVGVFVYSLLISSISSIYHEWDINKKQMHRKLESLAILNAQYHFPLQQLKAAEKHIRSSKAALLNTDIVTFMSELPKNYRVVIGGEVFRHTLQKISFFKDKSKEFLTDVGMKLKKMKFDKGDWIYLKKEIADDVIFIHSGCVSVKGGDSDRHEICEIVAGELYGECDILINKSIRKYSVESKEDTICFILKRQDLKWMMERYREETRNITIDAKRKDMS